MKKGKYIVALIVLLTVLLSLSSCWVPDKFTYDEIHAEFSQYGQSNDVMFYLPHALYFHDHEVDLDALFPSKKIVLCATLLNNQIYIAVEITETKPHSIALYSCDLYGNNLKKVFEQNAHNTNIHAQIEEGILYFNVFKDDETKIMSFDILKEKLDTVYENYSGSIVRPIEPTRTYAIQKQDGAFLVTHRVTGEQRIIDDAYLQKTEFYDSMLKFDYRISNYSTAEDKVILVYHFEIRSFFDLFMDDGYPSAIFEYDFENDTLIFKATAAPYDCEGYMIRNNVIYDQP